MFDTSVQNTKYVLLFISKYLQYVILCACIYTGIYTPKVYQNTKQITTQEELNVGIFFYCQHPPYEDNSIYIYIYITVTDTSLVNFTL